MIFLQQISYAINHLAPGFIQQMKMMLLNYIFESHKTFHKRFSMDEEQENAFLIKVDSIS